MMKTFYRVFLVTLLLPLQAYAEPNYVAIESNIVIERFDFKEHYVGLSARISEETFSRDGCREFVELYLEEHFKSYEEDYEDIDKRHYGESGYEGYGRGSVEGRVICITESDLRHYDDSPKHDWLVSIHDIFEERGYEDNSVIDRENPDRNTIFILEE